jgi:hypothetical protein
VVQEEILLLQKLRTQSESCNNFGAQSSGRVRGLMMGRDVLFTAPRTDRM